MRFIIKRKERPKGVLCSLCSSSSLLRESWGVRTSELGWGSLSSEVRLCPQGLLEGAQCLCPLQIRMLESNHPQGDVVGDEVLEILGLDGVLLKAVAIVMASVPL